VIAGDERLFFTATPFCGSAVTGLVGWDLGDKKGTAMETPEDLEEFE